MSTLTMSKTQTRTIEIIGQTAERHGAAESVVEGAATWLYGDVGIRWAEGALPTADLRRLHRVLEQYLTGVSTGCPVHANSLRTGRYGQYCPSKVAHRSRDGSLTTRWCRGGLDGLTEHLAGRGTVIPAARAGEEHLVEQAYEQETRRREERFRESTRRLVMSGIDLDRKVRAINPSVPRQRGEGRGFSAVEFETTLCYCPCTPGPHIASDIVFRMPGGGNYGFHSSDIAHSQCKPLSAQARRLYEELRLLERGSILMSELMDHLPFWPRKEVMDVLLPELNAMGLVGVSDDRY